MGKKFSMLWLPLFGLFMTVLFVFGTNFSMAYEAYWKSLPPEIPGDYEGKWYGIYADFMEEGAFCGVTVGAQFTNQEIINSWGYKAKPIEEIKDLIPETFYGIVTNPQKWGDFRINETAYIPRDQWVGDNIKLLDEATERNKGTARLTEQGHLVDYKNGIPFPGTTKGIEHAWNMLNALTYGQQMWCDFYVGVTDKKGHKRHCRSEQNYYWWKGRVHGKDVPAYEPNPNNYSWYAAMGFMYPYDLRGIVILTHRYDDPDKADDMWMYIPVLRRIRRMSTSQRWDKLPGGQDITYDAATGFQGKPTNYDWNYLGTKHLLVCRQGVDELQEIKDKPGGGVANQLFQRADVIVLEYIPKIVSTVSKAVMYLDPDSYACYYVDFFDKRGRPYLHYTHGWVVDKNGCSVPMAFLVVDVQRTHCSNIYVASLLFNMDAEEKKDINPEFFVMPKLRARYKGR